MRQMVGSTDEFLTMLPHLIAILGAIQKGHVQVFYFFLTKQKTKFKIKNFKG